VDYSLIVSLTIQVKRFDRATGSYEVYLQLTYFLSESVAWIGALANVLSGAGTEIIDGFLRTHGSLREELRTYALSAQRGCVL
jgi:hypothetical protein